MPRRLAADIGLVAALMFLVAMTTSRVTLVLHELIGHGLVAKITGADISGYKLFVFAGGWIQYERAEPFSLAERLSISLGGIAVEIVLGAALVLVARRAARGSVLRIAAAGWAAIVLFHAGFYFAAGGFHGYGDGWLLYRWLGDARVPVTVAAGVATVAATFALARWLGGDFRALLARHGRRVQLAAILVASLGAAGLHGALTFGELALERDTAYIAVMTDQATREVEREVAVYEHSVRAERGAPPSAREVAEVRRRLADEHRPFPFKYALAVACFLAFLAGLWRSTAAGARPLAPRQLVPLAGVCAASVALVAIAQTFAP